MTSNFLDTIIQEIKSTNMKHIYPPIKGLQDLIDMVNKQDDTDISALFNTAYIRGYGQGCEDTKKHITLIINANNN